MTQDERAFHAKALRDNPVYREAIISARNEIIGDLEDTDITDVKAMQSGALSLQMLNKIESYIKACIDDEKLREMRKNEPSFF